MAQALIYLNVNKKISIIFARACNDPLTLSYQVVWDCPGTHLFKCYQNIIVLLSSTQGINKFKCAYTAEIHI